MWQFGAGKFLEAGCPETRCYLTSDRNLLGSVADFDAILFHQVSCDWWTADGGGHVTSVLLSDWSLTSALGEAAGRARGAAAGAALRALDVRVARPCLLGLNTHYQAKQLLQLEHELHELDKHILKFGEANIHLAKKTNVKGLAAAFVSNCNSVSGREKVISELKK